MGGGAFRVRKVKNLESNSLMTGGPAALDPNR